MKDVCIIGAGVSGIVTARYLQEKFKVTIFEGTSSIGGVWVYDDSNEGKTTPMYKNLRTNLPKQLMTFRDLQYEKDLPTFLTHYQVLSYLEQYCDMFSIKPLIKFNTTVELLKPDGTNDKMKWLVKTNKGTSLFDAVAVCSGHFHIPSIPSIPGKSLYEGRCIHSKDYSTPEPLIGSSVLVVGNQSSAVDIAIDLYKHEVDVHISHRGKECLPGFPDSIKQYAEPVQFDHKSIHFKNGEMAYFDVIIFATGYQTNLNFVHPSCAIETDILPRPLYRYCINCKYPTMAIMNQCYKDSPFLLSEYQAAYYRDLLLKKIQLGKEDELLAKAEDLLALRADQPLKYRYALYADQFPYYAELAAECGLTLDGSNDLTTLSDIYEVVRVGRKNEPMVYRSREYKF